MQTRALLFDLFGTVVNFASHVPKVEVAGTQWRTTMGWLHEAVARELPGVALDDLLAALMAVTQEIVHQRPPEYREVPSRERFRRALMRLDVDAERAPGVAERLSLTHMGHIASRTEVPAAHVDALRNLAARFPLGLVSNFDHAPTAHRILDTHGLAGFFKIIVISDEFGRRKPHPAIFAHALATLGSSAQDALFIGDSVSDDVIGAQSACISTVWLNADGNALPAGVPAPDYTIAQLPDLLGLLA